MYRPVLIQPMPTKNVPIEELAIAQPVNVFVLTASLVRHAREINVQMTALDMAFV